jgi:hypothetical protein
LTSPKNLQPEHADLVSDSSGEAPTPNPFAGAANISVSVPETVEIKLVDATALADYEIWFLLTSISASAFVGFLVATLQATGESEKRAFIAFTIILGIFLFIFAVMAFCKRRKMSSKTKELKFKVGEQVED